MALASSLSAAGNHQAVSSIPCRSRAATSARQTSARVRTASRRRDASHPAAPAISARCSGDRFCVSKGTMHQATRLVRAKKPSAGSAARRQGAEGGGRRTGPASGRGDAWCTDASLPVAFARLKPEARDRRSGKFSRRPPQLGDKRQVPVAFVEVQSVSDDEDVRHLETHVVHTNALRSGIALSNRTQVRRLAG